MLYRMIIILLFLSAGLFSADFFSYYAEFSQKLYQDNEIIHVPAVKSRGWDRIFSLYEQLYELRLQKETDTDDLCDEVEDVIDDIDDGVITGLSKYEKEFLSALFYGSLAYIKSSDPGLGMFRDVRRSKKLFEEMNLKYRTSDTAFGGALSEIALGMYFQNSFWVNSVLGYNGNILKGLKDLDNIAFSGEITKIEANLFLIEYFGIILKDHNSSVRYSRNLFEINQGSKYFKYLYARDLYHNGKIKQAYIIFKDINGSISDRFYAFQYESVIYEARCLYISGEIQEAEAVIKYASGIHDGYILKKFRNEWISSVRIRREIVFRPQYAYGADPALSDDELRRSAFIYFDHGFFREAARTIDAIKKPLPEVNVLKFKTAVIMQDWKRAEKIYDIHGSEFDDDPDRARIGLLINIMHCHLN
jgi:hypothetical protein